jgi:hypothetical protein
VGGVGDFVEPARYDVASQIGTLLLSSLVVSEGSQDASSKALQSPHMLPIVSNAIEFTFIAARPMDRAWRVQGVPQLLIWMGLPIQT